MSSRTKRRAKQRSQKKKQIEADLRRQHNLANILLWSGRIALATPIAYVCYHSVSTIYGKELGNWLIATADQYSRWKPVLELVQDFGGWAFGLISYLFGGKRRKNLVQKNEELTVRNAYLEGLLDNKRTSSKMPPDGSTRKGDR